MSASRSFKNNVCRAGWVGLFLYTALFARDVMTGIWLDGTPSPESIKARVAQTSNNPECVRELVGKAGDQITRGGVDAYVGFCNEIPPKGLKADLIPR